MKKIFNYFVVLLLLVLYSKAIAQEEILKYLDKFSVSASVNFYYAYDTDKNKLLREFSSSSPHRDEFRLNLAKIAVKYSDESARGTFAIHYGDIVKENWNTSNPNIQQANIGIKLFESIWIDAGYFVSYLGEESFPNESPFSSFALPSHYQPFYESGIRVNYDYKDYFGATIHIINGFNVIEDNNKNKSFGLQLYYKPNKYLEFIYNNLMGNEMPSSAQGKMRLMNDFIFSFGPYKNIKATLLFNLTLQENSKINDSTSTAYVYGILAILKYNITSKFSTMLRGEYYQDLDGVLSEIVYNNIGMKGNGITIGCEYRPIEKAYFRFETRYLRLDDALRIFYNNKNERMEFIISSGISF